VTGGRGRDAASEPAGALAQLAAVSGDLGTEPGFCLAGGGNSSVKADGVLYIKPSGVALAALTPDVLIPLDLARLQAALDEDAAAPGSDPVLELARAARLTPDDGRRPSVELLFHSLLARRFVVHTHPTVVNMLTCCARGEALAAELLGDEALWIPYTNPGMPLAARIRDALVAFERRGNQPAPDAILLQNHGLIVAADEALEVAARSRELVARIGAHVDALPPLEPESVARIDAELGRSLVAAVTGALAARLGTPGAAGAILHDGSPLALLIAGSDLGRSWAAGGPLTPDQIVYAGSWPLLVDLPARADAAAAIALVEAAFLERGGQAVEAPIISLVAGLGLFAAGRTERDAATARDIYLDAARVAWGAHRLGGVRAMASEERAFIEHWEAEAYRRQVSHGAVADGSPA
jgi:rhamnose utilization protein RhaD (predicted bifunctional aldolase and dehydrogenase)